MKKHLLPALFLVLGLAASAHAECQCDTQSIGSPTGDRAGGGQDAERRAYETLRREQPGRSAAGDRAVSREHGEDKYGADARQ